MSGSGAKRIQHYMFAHRVLPQLFFSDPAQFIATLTSDGDKFVRFFWDRLGQQIKEPDGRVDPAGLHGEVRLLDYGVEAALITLPAPAAMAEAYFVAGVYHPAFNGAALARYFTLEYGINLQDSSPRTVFCGWTAEGAHFNMGDGPAADPDAFLDVVQARLDGPARP